MAEGAGAGIGALPLLLAGAVPLAPRQEAERTESSRRAEGSAAVAEWVRRLVRQHITQQTTNEESHPGAADPADISDPAVDPARGEVTTSDQPPTAAVSDLERPPKPPPATPNEASHNSAMELLPSRRRRHGTRNEARNETRDGGRNEARDEDRDGGRDGDRDGGGRNTVTATVMLVGCVTVLLAVLLRHISRH